MEKYTRWIFKFKKPLMAIFILLNLTAIYGVTQIKISTSFDVFKTQDSEYTENMRILEEEFPSSDEMIVLCEYDDLLKDKVLAFEDMARGLSGIKLVKGIETAESSLPISVDELSPIKTVDGTC